MTISSLAKKLQLKTGTRGVLINAPLDFRQMVEPLPEGTVLLDELENKIDFILIFTQDRAELEQWMKTAVTAVKDDGLLWLAYPKKSSDVKTDLTRDEGWASLTQAGYRPIRQIALDDTWSALRFRLSEGGAADLLAAQYAGDKVALRPIYDHLVQTGQQLGSDVTLAIRKSYVALVRGKQFAVIVPSTKTRLDLGLKFKEKPFTDRLVEANNLGSGSITHKVALTSMADVDEELLNWLKESYEKMG
jgi:predicted transport protein